MMTRERQESLRQEALAPVFSEWLTGTGCSLLIQEMPGQPEELAKLGPRRRIVFNQYGTPEQIYIEPYNNKTSEEATSEDVVILVEHAVDRIQHQQLLKNLIDSAEAYAKERFNKEYWDDAMEYAGTKQLAKLRQKRIKSDQLKARLNKVIQRTRK